MTYAMSQVRIGKETLEKVQNRGHGYENPQREDQEVPREGLGKVTGNSNRILSCRSREGTGTSEDREDNADCVQKMHASVHLSALARVCGDTAADNPAQCPRIHTDAHPTAHWGYL